MPIKPWKTIRDEELQDLKIASRYLTDISETGTVQEIVLALQYVLEANGSKPANGRIDELIQLRHLGLHVNVSHASVNA